MQNTFTRYECAQETSVQVYLKDETAAYFKQVLCFRSEEASSFGCHAMPPCLLAEANYNT